MSDDPKARVFDKDDDSDGFSQRPIINITPGQQKKPGDVDFESGKPVIEQVLEGHRIDRTDKTQTETQEPPQAIVKLSLWIIGILALIILILVLFK